MTQPRHMLVETTAPVIRFWGTRGGIPVPGPEMIRYGGDTSCIEMRCGPHLVILDAGTGLRRLGTALAAEGTAITADLLLSHTHLDHIVGIGFFAPLYKADTTIHLYGGHLPVDDLRRAIHAVLSSPLSPDLLGVSRARFDIHAITPGHEFAPRPGLTIKTVPLRHPGGSTGYRIEWCGQSVVYLTDVEHEPGHIDPQVLALTRGADLLIYDANYTDEEFNGRLGWGHSTWQEAIRLANAAQVGQLVLFHHDSERTDNALDQIATAAAEQRPGTITAFDGLVLTL